jgi:two-component system, NtrC family, nitrogen regulation response regulator NtrX
MADILIIDDEKDIREMIAGLLEDEGYQTRTAGNSDKALLEITTRQPSLIFLDIWLQGSKLDGLQILDHIKELYPDLPVVMISGHGTIDTAVSALKKGAYDYIEKPFKADRLVLTAERALETQRLKREIKELKTLSVQANELIGKSNAILALKQTIAKIAPTKSRVMITGQQGAGKELVARSLHGASPRANAPFVIVSAATITPDKTEEAFFGIEARGQEPRHRGALEEAHGGTLYIDEIADMPRDTQTKFLRVLTEQSFTRVGGSDKITVDVRVISSTSVNVELEIAEGRLRDDLYHRLAVVPVSVPALSERREDIPELVAYFIAQMATNSGLTPRIIGDDVMAVLQSHDWPGNVRQLRNTIERLLILAGGNSDEPVSVDLLPPDVLANSPSLPSGNGGENLMAMPLRDAREIFERDYLLSQINRFSGNISKTAEFVGMERSALHRKLKSLGVNA